MAEEKVVPTLRPLRDLVYVRQDPLPEKASGSALFIPDSTKKHVFTRHGTVLAVGPGRLVCRRVEEVFGGPLAHARDGDTWESDEGERGGIPSHQHAIAIDPFGQQWITSLLRPQLKPGDRVMFPDFWGTCVGLETDPSLLIGPASDEDTGSGLLAVMEVE